MPRSRPLPRPAVLAARGLLCLAGLAPLASATPGAPPQDLQAAEPQEPGPGPRQPQPVLRRLQVGETERQALVYLPRDAVRRAGRSAEELAEAQGSPVVLVFHGHGGTARQIARRAPVHAHWPEAVVVYPQGLRTPGALTDPEGKRFGWQHGAGDQDGRDLAFVDLILETLGEELVLDPRRLHATGHSNGGGFSYLLWAERGEQFASFAPSAAAATKTLRQAELAPRPVLHFGSEDDPLVRWAWQERTLEGLKRLFGCGEGEPWAALPGVTRFPSETGAHLYLMQHEGGHRMYPELAAAAAVFFRAHPLPPGSAAEVLDGGPAGHEHREHGEHQEGGRTSDHQAEPPRSRRAA